MSNIEQTLSIIKPDAVERNLENEIKKMFENKGFNIIKAKKMGSEAGKSLSKKVGSGVGSAMRMATSAIKGKDSKTTKKLKTLFNLIS